MAVDVSVGEPQIMGVHPYADKFPMLGEDEQLEGHHLDPICYVTISESREHPGFYDCRAHAGGYENKTKRPIRAEFVWRQVDALLTHDTNLTSADLTWSTYQRAAVAPACPGSVYFIADEDGYIKIGHARNVLSRLASLQTASRQNLRLVATTSGSQADERALHARFASDRVRGEWFRPSPALLLYIDKSAVSA